jgi:chromosome segregation ATPase
MSEDFTQKLPKNGNDSEILTALKGVAKKLDSVENKIISLETKVDSLETKVDSLETKVDSLETKVDTRLYDTRPIWHKVVADIAQLQAGQQRLEEGQQAMRVELRNVSRDQIVINDSIRKIQLDYHAIDDRLDRLEQKRNQQNSTT